MKKKEKPKTVKVKKEKFNAMDHWKGMPEFNQPGLEPVKVVKVNFASKEYMLKFSKLIGQEITAKTPSVWFPIAPVENALDKRWSDKKTTKKK